MSSWNESNKYNNGWDLANRFLMDDAWFVPKSFLLDIFPATAAYSVGRQLGSDQLYAMWVRREIDNAELKIGFDGTGNTDEAAIASFCGASNGFVPLLVDACNNGYDLTQPIATKQPKIYDGATGLVVTENGKITLEFDGIDDSIFSAGTLNIATPFNIFFAYRWVSLLGTTGYPKALLCGDSVRSTCVFRELGSYVDIYNGLWLYSDVIGADLFRHTVSLLFSNFGNYYLDGNLIVGGNTGNFNITKIIIGNDVDNYSRHPNFKLNELIIYNTDQSTNRANIEFNINSYWSIY